VWVLRKRKTSQRIAPARPLLSFGTLVAERPSISLVRSTSLRSLIKTDATHFEEDDDQPFQSSHRSASACRVLT